MSIRDIIEKWRLISANYAQHGYTAAVHARDFEEMRDDFASALEELSLMEAVCEAAATYRNTQSDGDLLVLLAESDCLTAYRKGRGL